MYDSLAKSPKPGDKRRTAVFYRLLIGIMSVSASAQTVEPSIPSPDLPDTVLERNLRQQQLELKIDQNSAFIRRRAEGAGPRQLQQLQEQQRRNQQRQDQAQDRLQTRQRSQTVSPAIDNAEQKLIERLRLQRQQRVDALQRKLDARRSRYTEH